MIGYVHFVMNKLFMTLILGLSFYTIVLEGFFFNILQGNREYEGEFPDFLGPKKYLHFKICRNNTFIS